MIVIVINNIEAFMESYNEYEELLGQLTRDCLKYGVVFVCSTNGPNTIRYRLRQNFRQNLVLQFNDPSDYGSVIPGVRKKEPSKAYGRGLILLDAIYEFQTGFPYIEEKMIDYIKIICNKLTKICSYRAKRIPILPETVTISDVSSVLGNLSTIPIGIEKESLEVATINLEDKFIFNITGEDVTSNPEFIKGLVKVITRVPNTNCIIMDPNTLLSDLNMDNVSYDKGACYNAIDNLNEAYNNKLNGDNTTTVCIFIGISALLNKLSSIEKGKLTTLIDDSKKVNSIRYIIIDTIDTIKSIAYEVWYKNNSDLSEAIWIGNGISNQFTIKVTTAARLLRVELQPGFGYIVQKGKAKVTKFLSDEE